MRFRLRDADRTLRLFLTTLVIVLSLGYFVGLLFVEHTTSMSPAGLSEEFAGSSDLNQVDEMKFAKSSREMFTFIHNHILSISLVFFVVGSIFYFSSLVSDRVKRFLLVEPLVAVVTTFGGIALVRFVGEEFSWLVIISGASLFLCYLTMVTLILHELWMTPKNSSTQGCP